VKHRVYTLWASLKEEASPWMLVGEDEFSWEGDPDRCEKAFQDAQNLCDENEWDYREVTLLIDYKAVVKCFDSTEVEADVEVTE